MHQGNVGMRCSNGARPTAYLMSLHGRFRSRDFSSLCRQRNSANAHADPECILLHNGLLAAGCRLHEGLLVCCYPVLELHGLADELLDVLHRTPLVESLHPDRVRNRQKQSRVLDTLRVGRTLASSCKNWNMFARSSAPGNPKPA